MRPVLEYASITCDCCTNYERDSLEKLQYEAARIVTGITRSSSINSLLKEIGWVSLSNRRKIQKLIIIYKEKQGKLPSYLHELFRQLVGANNTYGLRNMNNFITLARRTELYSKSFIPSSVASWNELDEDIQTSETINGFKNKLKLLFRPPIVPDYFLIGDRTLSIYHCRMRNKCSNLNADLHRNHLRESPVCECSVEDEDAEQFIFKCQLYHQQRVHLFEATRRYHPLSVQTLLFGHESLTMEDNSCIFTEAHNYIKHTRRFNN